MTIFRGHGIFSLLLYKFIIYLGVNVLSGSSTLATTPSSPNSSRNNSTRGVGRGRGRPQGSRGCNSAPRGIGRGRGRPRGSRGSGGAPRGSPNQQNGTSGTQLKLFIYMETQDSLRLICDIIEFFEMTQF